MIQRVASSALGILARIQSITLGTQQLKVWEPDRGIIKGLNAQLSVVISFRCIICHCNIWMNSTLNADTRE